MSQTMLAYGFLAIAIVSEVTGATFLALLFIFFHKL